MTLGDAFAQLWPIVATIGGGYVALLVYIRQQFEQRLREKDEQIAKLEGRLERREEYVWRSLSATEASAALAQSLAGAKERQP